MILIALLTTFGHTHRPNYYTMYFFFKNITNIKKWGWWPKVACGVALFYVQWRIHLNFNSSSPTPNERLKIKHVTSNEWHARKTQEVNFLKDDTRRVIVYRNDFENSVWTHELKFWDKIQRNEWEPTTFKIIKHYLEDHADASYIDFGAWIGPTVLFAAQFSKHVYALEPDQQAFSALVANVNANSDLVSNVQLFHECINTESGPMTFRGKGDSTSRFSSTLNVGNVANLPEWTIACRSLPEFIAQEDVTNLRLIKIDTEGAELFLLPSLVGWLHQLSSPKPSLWLSLHQPFWKEDVSIAAKQAFWTALRAYRYVYFEGTTPVTMREDNYDTLCEEFCSYLLSDEEFVMPS